ncbi:YdcH family protein [Neptunicella sp.]|uniref:YdcH family protein n=1 Tax=Neptunicella sp. TaxID=2125986 RepID=UPI003F68C368
MLGENHSLLHDFPEHKSTIQGLVKSDKAFADNMQQYDALDKEIRTLELDNSPVDDEAMAQKKHQRALLKDALYQCLLANK